jgi:streptomycin 6-kinase
MTDTPRVPADVIAGVKQRWPDRAAAWASHIEAELHDLCTRHHATPRRVLPARYGFVVAADSPHGPIILRSSPDPHGPEQAAVAVALANLDIAPAVYETVTTDHGTWTILDQVLPGTPLADADPSSVTLDALVSPLAAMNGQPPPIPGMPSIIDWLRDRLEDDHLTELPPGHTIALAEERCSALRVLDELADEHTPGLCHGDASTWNILANGSAGWKLIDPRGMTGETAYDVAVLAVKVAPRLPLRNAMPLLTDISGTEMERVKAWMIIAKTARV